VIDLFENNHSDGRASYICIQVIAPCTDHADDQHGLSLVELSYSLDTAWRPTFDRWPPLTLALK
jgi:hypothetical protein